MMSDKLRGRVALITGAGRGIGRAIALKLSSEGARIVINDLDAEPASEVVRAIERLGGEAVACPGDVTDPTFADRFVDAAVESFGGLDIVVNNAGYTWDNVIQKMTDDQWRAIIDCHLTAPFQILRSAYPAIKRLAAEDAMQGEDKTRKIVNISSIGGLLGNPGQINYDAAKAGVIGMTRTLAKEWGRLRVTVNCVAFGLIETRLTVPAGAESRVTVGDHEIKVGINDQLMASMKQTIPLGRAGTTQDAAGAVYLLCIPESDYISGHTLVCSGGLNGL